MKPSFFSLTVEEGALCKDLCANKIGLRGVEVSNSKADWAPKPIRSKACRLGHTARYFRATALLSELEVSRADGRYRRLLSSLGKINCLIIDNFCLSSLTETEEKDLFELIEERHNSTSTIFTSQNPANLWHGLMPNPAIADAVLDRIVHHAVRIVLKGESFRKKS